MAREYTIILGIILIGITFTIFLGTFNPNTDKVTTAPIPEPVIEVEEKVYEKYEMGNYR
tara:strand:- start:99 stop:275 length:177 start_codon:yes stop_codon:yes gene_type:complete